MQRPQKSQNRSGLGSAQLMASASQVSHKRSERRCCKHTKNRSTHTSLHKHTHTQRNTHREVAAEQALTLLIFMAQWLNAARISLLSPPPPAAAAAALKRL